MNTRSDNLDHLLRRKLGFFLTHGMSVFFIFLLLLVPILYLIKVPDTIEGKIILSTNPPPVDLVSKINGRITSLNVSDGDLVRKGQIMCSLETTAKIADVYFLEKQLTLIDSFLRFGDFETEFLSRLNVQATLELGEIQDSFENFRKVHDEIRLFSQHGYLEQQISLIANKKQQINNLLQSQYSQIKLLDRDYNIANQNFKMDSIFEIDKTISVVQLRATESIKIRAELNLNNALQGIINNRQSLILLEEQTVLLDQKYEQLKSNFISSYKILFASVKEWKNRFLMISTKDGVISFNRNIYPGLNVGIGEQIMFVIPPKYDIVFEFYVSQQNFGKIKPGQKCVIKLDSYNFEEFGTIEGSVFTISDIPQKLKLQDQEQIFYLVTIKPSSNLKTSLNYPINVRFGLTGSANVILDNKNLLEKLILDRIKGLFVYQ